MLPAGPQVPRSPGPQVSGCGSSSCLLPLRPRLCSYPQLLGDRELAVLSSSYPVGRGLDPDLVAIPVAGEGRHESDGGEAWALVSRDVVWALSAISGVGLSVP